MCRTDLALEILASRQQVALLKRKSPPETESDGSDILDSVRRVWSRLSPLARGRVCHRRFCLKSKAVRLFPRRHPRDLY